MGCFCSKGSSNASFEKPAMNIAKLKDPFVKFEKSFPFYRMHIENFRTQIYSFGKDMISIEDLQNRFSGAIWKNQFDEGSELNLLLRALPGSVDDSVDINSIIVLGLIWCTGDYEDKAEALF